MSDVKARIRWKDNEIEFQGTKTEVDGLLESWWTRLQAPAGDGPEFALPSRKKKVRKSPSAPTEPAESTGDTFSASVFANALKEEAKFPHYSDKVLNKKDGYNKVALVCWYEDDPLTSGEISNALKALDVKADQGFISRTIKANSGKFTASHPRKKGGGTRPKYKLTSHARAEFEAWLGAKP
jgi:hypothetical protein